MKFALKYEEWKDDYNWLNCALKRKQFGEFISAYLRSSSKLVLNLNGKWGTGKTHFLKRMYVDLAQQNHPVIYIDAWESDFSSNPLSVIASEIVKQLSSIKGLDVKQQGALKELANKLGTALKYSQPTVAAYNMITGNPEPEVVTAAKISENTLKVASELSTEPLSASNGKLLEKIKDAHFAQIEAMRDIKSHLKFIAELLELIDELKLPIIVLVDELDRCRPSYAVEFLEVIKHFFETEHFVFVCASDTGQLEESIRTIYGSKFDSGVYLRRFFDRTINLPAPDIKSYIETKDLDYLCATVNTTLFPFKSNLTLVQTFLSMYFESINQSTKYHFELRDIDQVLGKLEALVSYLESNTPQNCSNLVAIVTAITYEHLSKDLQASTSLSKCIYVEGSFFGLSLQQYIHTQEILVKETISKSVYDGNTRREFRSPVPCLVYQASSNDYLYKGDSDMTVRNTAREEAQLYTSKEKQYLLIEDIVRLVKLSGSIS